jgi:hypothetical protein
MDVDTDDEIILTRFSKIIAGILLGFFASLIIVLALGVGGFQLFSESGAVPMNLATPINTVGDTSPMLSPIEGDVWEFFPVPGAEGCYDVCHDTEAGRLMVSYDIPEVFPLCIDEAYIDANFGLKVWSFGGYHPEDAGMNLMTLYQPKTGLGGAIAITWHDCGTVIGPLGCETVLYVASFDLVDGPIQLDSNHLPDPVCVSGCDFPFVLDCPPSDNLNKWVFVSIITSWEGCHDMDQKFKLILAHLNESCPQNPQLPMNILIFIC